MNIPLDTRLPDLEQVETPSLALSQFNRIAVLESHNAGLLRACRMARDHLVLCHILHPSHHLIRELDQVIDQ